MKSLLIGLLLLSILTSALADTQTQELTLRAAVLQVAPISSYLGKIMPVDADPRYVLVLRIESATPPNTKFVTGSTNAFAIHSPTRLGLQPSKDKIQTFQIKQTTIDGKIKIEEMKVICSDAK